MDERDSRVGVVMITYNRREEALRSVGRLLELPERPQVVVVDNGSTDGTAAALRTRFCPGSADAAAPAPVSARPPAPAPVPAPARVPAPAHVPDGAGAAEADLAVEAGSDPVGGGAAEGGADLGGRVEVVASPANLGAVGRNVGARRLTTPYVAFCDDDTWWEPGSLRAAADVLDAHPDVAVLTARIVAEPGGREDPIVPELRDSPVPGRPGLPGPALGSFLAGASVLRRGAFLGRGGFSRRLWLGGEEELLAVDLVTEGWELCYLESITVHHEASVLRDPAKRRRDGLRNTLWFTWLRRPARTALRRTAHLAVSVPRDRTSVLAALDALRGARWVLAERRRVPRFVEARLASLDASQRRSQARRYVG